MKRVFAITICVLLVIISVLNVGAAKRDADSTFVIDELGISLYVPMHYVATRTSNNFDMEPEEFEYTVKDFEQNDIYLWGGSKFYNEEIYLHGVDTNVKSFDHFTEEGLEEIADNIKDNVENNGYIVTRSEIYESYNATYILTHYYNNEENYAISYSTIENYKDIVLTMWSYGSEPTANQRKDFLSIIINIEYDADTQATEIVPAETEDNNDILFYENTIIFELADEGKLTTMGIAVIVIIASVIFTLIAGAVVAIILISKSKKRRRSAAQKAVTAEGVQSTKHCIHCGTQISDADTFCFICGKSRTTIPSNTENEVIDSNDNN